MDVHNTVSHYSFITAGLYENGPTVSLGCTSTHFMLSVKQWPTEIHPTLQEMFIQCDDEACVSLYHYGMKNYYRQK